MVTIQGNIRTLLHRDWSVQFGDAFTPGGDQKRAAISHFHTYRSLKKISKLELRPFRVNTF